MFDKIKSLERKAVKGFGFIDKFIKKLEKARDRAAETKNDSNYQILRLKEIIKSCDRVRGFTEKLLKAVK